MTTKRSAALAHWATSVQRSVACLQQLGVYVTTKHAGQTVRGALNLAIVKAVQTEMSARICEGQYDHLPVGEDRVAKDQWPVRAAEIGLALEAAGWEKSVLPEDVVVYRRDSDSISMDMDGEWIFRTSDETRAGDNLRDLAKLLSDEEN